MFQNSILNNDLFLLIACSYRSHRRCLELIRRPCASRKVRAKLALEISTLSEAVSS